MNDRVPVPYEVVIKAKGYLEGALPVLRLNLTKEKGQKLARTKSKIVIYEQALLEINTFLAHKEKSEAEAKAKELDDIDKFFTEALDESFPTAEDKDRA